MTLNRMSLRLMRDDDWGWLLMRGPVVVAQLQHLRRGVAWRSLRARSR